MNDSQDFQPSPVESNENVATAQSSNATSPKIEGNLTVNSEFSSSQLTRMAEWEVEAGRLTREEANRMLAADGAPLIQKPIDPNSPEAYVDSIMPPAEPKQFTMPQMNFDDPTGEEARNMDKFARSILSDARFTREIGNFVAEEVARSSTKFESMSEAERMGYKSEQLSMLRNIWKGDLSRKLGIARSFVNHLEAMNPGFKNLLDTTGAGDNAMIIAKFVMQAELMLERQRK